MHIDLLCLSDTRLTAATTRETIEDKLPNWEIIHREDSEDRDRNPVSDSIAKDNKDQECFNDREAANNREEPKLTFTPPHQKRVNDKIKMFELSPSMGGVVRL